MYGIKPCEVFKIGLKEEKREPVDNKTESSFGSDYKIDSKEETDSEMSSCEDNSTFTGPIPITTAQIANKRPLGKEIFNEVICFYLFRRFHETNNFSGSRQRSKVNDFSKLNDGCFI